MYRKRNQAPGSQCGKSFAKNFQTGVWDAVTPQTPGSRIGWEIRHPHIGDGTLNKDRVAGALAVNASLP
jgi:hypothetical protein